MSIALDMAGRIREGCRLLNADRLVTLTYRGRRIEEADVARDFDLFRRRVGWVPPVGCAYLSGSSERTGAVVMVAIHGRQNVRLLSGAWTDVVGAGNGSVHVRNPPGGVLERVGWRVRLADYMAGCAVRGFDGALCEGW